MTDRDNVQFQTLSSGVKVQQLRPGDGASVGRSSTIAVEATGRLLNLNGVQFYSTKRLAGADALGGAEPQDLLGATEGIGAGEAFRRVELHAVQV